MTQVQTGATFRKGRLLRSAAASAFALSALAGGFILSGGEAKALCASPNADQVNYTDTINGQVINFQDKLSNVSCGNYPTTTAVDLELSGLLYPYAQKQVDIDYNPPLANGLTDMISYTLTKTGTTVGGQPVKVWFDQASLAFTAFGNGGSVLKEIYDKDPATGGTLIASLSNNTGVANYVGIPGMYSSIYVKDTITSNVGGTVDNVINDFRDVPGPLPILGAGAAFGFSRKLRGRIKAASNA